MAAAPMFSGLLGPLHRLLAGRRAASIWTRGEREAERLMKSRGYRLLGRNVRVAAGEIDLLFDAGPGGPVVLVEVKARQVRDAESARLPERAITSAKARKLATLARSLGRSPACRGRRVRIDVVAVDFGPGDAVETRHYENAIDARGRRV